MFRNFRLLYSEFITERRELMMFFLEKGTLANCFIMSDLQENVWFGV